MNTSPVLSFVVLSVIGLFIFHKKEHINEVIALTVILVGAFFALLSFGMYEQGGEVAYVIFVWLGLMLSGTSVAMVVLSIIPPRTNFSRS